MLKKKMTRFYGILMLFLVSIFVILAGCSGPQIPASHYTGGVLQNNYTNCTDCHQSGVNNAPKEPSSHAKYTNDMCSKCHKPS